MKIILENKILSLCILIFALLVIGIEMGVISNPMIKNMIGMVLIGGGAALLFVIPIFIIPKLWLWIKSKL